jgi:hypothetical protein
VLLLLACGWNVPFFFMGGVGKVYLLPQVKCMRNFLEVESSMSFSWWILLICRTYEATLCCHNTSAWWKVQGKVYGNLKASEGICIHLTHEWRRLECLTGNLQISRHKIRVNFNTIFYFRDVWS